MRTRDWLLDSTYGNGLFTLKVDDERVDHVKLQRLLRAPNVGETITGYIDTAFGSEVMKVFKPEEFERRVV